MLFFSVLCLLCLCVRLFICALWSRAGKRLPSWLSFVVANCEIVTFPLVSCVRCGTRLYRFLIIVPLLTLKTQRELRRLESSTLQESLSLFNHSMLFDLFVPL